MKKLVGIVAGIACLSLIGCGKGENNNENEVEPDPTKGTITATYSFAGSVSTAGATLRPSLYLTSNTATIPWAKGNAVAGPTFPQAVVFADLEAREYYVSGFLDFEPLNPFGGLGQEDKILQSAKPVTVTAGGNVTVELMITNSGPSWGQ